MTQARLAELTDYTDRSSIAKIERGDVDLPQSKILLFAEALGVIPGTLMGNDGVSPAAGSVILSPDQEELLAYYDKLNASGKQKVRDYASDLTEQKKYIEPESSGKQNTRSA